MPKLEVRLSAEEKEALQKAADASGQNVSEYVRKRLFEAAVTKTYPSGPPLDHKYPPSANWLSPPARTTEK